MMIRNAITHTDQIELSSTIDKHEKEYDVLHVCKPLDSMVILPAAPLIHVFDERVISFEEKHK